MDAEYIALRSVYHMWSRSKQTISIQKILIIIAVIMMACYYIVLHTNIIAFINLNLAMD